jgi:hypothetical protein
MWRTERMKRTTGLMLVVALLAFPAGLAAADGAAFEFRYVAPPGGIPDFSVKWYELPLTLAPPPDWTIESLELDIVGLTHGNPADLNVFLLDPYGGGIEIMDDAGDSVPIVATRLMFRDSGDPLPHDPLVPLAGYPPKVYRPETIGAFAQYYGDPVGTAPWFAVVIDDNINGALGSFQSLTLRGIAVPEPVTLTLLACGAIVALRRRR